MNPTSTIQTILTTGAATLFTFAIAAAVESEAALLAQAKIGRAEATTIALQRVDKGTVKSTELEKEHGKLVWSFDIAQPQTKNITEVQVDAGSGQIVSVATETPAQQRQEAAQDHAAK